MSETELSKTASAQSSVNGATSTDGLGDGFYMLTGPNGEEPCLVRLYTPKEPPIRGIGFGVWDGGAFMPLSDLRDGSKLNPVKIVRVP
jgi:hypothetical protein